MKVFGKSKDDGGMFKATQGIDRREFHKAF